MWLFDDDTWWQWFLKQMIRLLLGLGLRELWHRLRGDQRDQGDRDGQRGRDDRDGKDGDRSPEGNRPGNEPASGRSSE